MTDLEFLAERWNCTPERVIAKLVSVRAQEERERDARRDRVSRYWLYKVGQVWVAEGRRGTVRREIVQVYESRGRRGAPNSYFEITFRQNDESFQRSVMWATFDRWARHYNATLAEQPVSQPR